MFCPKCGSEVQEGSAFCGKCGAPVSAPAGVSASGSDAAGAAGAGAPAAKKGGAKVGLIAAAVVVVVVLVTGFATNWFEFGGVQPKEAVDVPAASGQGADGGAQAGDSAAGDGQSDASGSDGQSGDAAAAGASVKSAVEAYTWDELAQISGEISQASDEAGAIEIAKKYNLCTADGRLDGTQVKSVTLADGTQTTVQIVGFAHDDKTAGGKAGITFIFGDAIGESSMNPESTNAGGWEDSELRGLLNSEGVKLLPEDLMKHVVAVDKLTNNVGETQSVSSVTVTSDKLWLFSATELCGLIDWYGSDYAACNDVLNAEGSEYKLYRDMAVDSYNSNAILVKNFDGEPRNWWGRSPRPDASGSFQHVYSDGDPYYYVGANLSYGVVPGFCI